MPKRRRTNNQIRAEKVRLVDQEGGQVGVIPLEEAIKKAKEKDLDLIEVAPNAKPPVCKIDDYSKFLYREKKKEKKQHSKKGGELKNIRLGFNISEHDLKTRMKEAEKFLNKGNKVRIEMRLRGREKALQDFAKEKIENFLKGLKESTSIKIEKELKKRPRGLTTIISKE